MKIEEGKFYKTRDGRKVGPMRLGHDSYFIDSGHKASQRYMLDGKSHWSDQYDIVSPWKEVSLSPVQSRMERFIVQGQYGRVLVLDHTFDDGGSVSVSITGSPRVDTSELRAAAITFTQLADFLEEQGK